MTKTTCMHTCARTHARAHTHTFTFTLNLEFEFNSLKEDKIAFVFSACKCLNNNFDSFCFCMYIINKVLRGLMGSM